MSKLKAAVATAMLLAGVAVSTDASAQCWWNGYGWACNHPPVYGYAPGSDFNSPSDYGYRPRGLPHPNGPDPGGGGCFMGQSSTGCSDH